MCIRDRDRTLPKDLDSIVANDKLADEFNMGAVHMLLLDSDLSTKQISDMSKEMEKVDGVKAVLGLKSIVGPAIPDSMIPSSLKDLLSNENYQIMLVTNEYATASDEVNSQITDLNQILKRYDPNGMLVGRCV